MRQLDRPGAVWWVHEIDTSHSPGARADRCLVFDCEGVVRRAWEYPDDWEALDDDALWALLDARPPVVRETPSSVPRIGASADHPAVVAAAQLAARSQQLITDVGAARSTNERLRHEHVEMFSACRRRCAEMRDAVRAYTAQLKREGVAPERALALVKSAVQEGLGGPTAMDTAANEKLFGDAVTSCIEAYYAA